MNRFESEGHARLLILAFRQFFDFYFDFSDAVII